MRVHSADLGEAVFETAQAPLGVGTGLLRTDHLQPQDADEFLARDAFTSRRGGGVR
ncbi:hypothetical protein [Parafrankia sp. EUN1f]|uniref:hypothetical protein n=1 Tax=Parafrankia sp. EUN1f TaxID=102897 RepID=UPI0012FB49AB|nr:hypothetical protein [Parafrankia sp. EUN1f]